ncbi:MAG: hypothetical protein LIO65_09110 [Odoribacter sp.]|nr:hypothetical protein [Odoribacter sp.]
MAEQKYFIDDRGIIPDEIKNMSQEEIIARIAALEAEASKEKAARLGAKAEEDKSNGNSN